MSGVEVAFVVNGCTSEINCFERVVEATNHCPRDAASRASTAALKPVYHAGGGGQLIGRDHVQQAMEAD